MLLILSILMFIKKNYLTQVAENVFSPATAQRDKTELHVRFTGIHHPKGKLFVALYDREAAFLNVQKAHTLKVLPIGEGGDFTLSLGDLPAGEYALASYHDLNNNGKLDKNLLGIPTEPYGFSNNARPKFRAPNWAEAKFALGEGGAAVAVRMEKW